MKIVILALGFTLAVTANAQTDSVKSKVYTWSDSVNKADPRTRKVLFDGPTLDLSDIRIHTSTLAPNQTNHPPVAHNEFEEVVVVKGGRLKVLIGDSTRILAAGGIALIVAGDLQSFQNASSTEPATYFVLRFISRNPVDIKRGRESGGSVIKNFDELVVKKTDKGESRPLFDRSTSMFKRLEIHATTLNPGFISHPPHTHREEELTFMIRGNGEMQVGQSISKLTAGDVVFAEANDLHGFKNTGNEPSTYYAIKWQN